jgi:hypothetical protein
VTSTEQNDGSPDDIDRIETSGEEPSLRFGPHHGETGAAEHQAQPQQDQLSARSAAIIAAVAKLAGTLHASVTSDAKRPQDLRKVAANILIKVIDLVLELYPDHPEWVIPLNQLLFGLKDLDRGKPNVLFETAKLNNRPPNTISDMIFRAIPAAAMTILTKKDRVKRAEAAEMIAKRLNKMGYRDRLGGPFKGIHVAQWREDIMAQRPRELAARRYQDALHEVEAMAPAEAVTYLLGSLLSLPPPHFPQNPCS